VRSVMVLVASWVVVDIGVKSERGKKTIWERGFFAGLFVSWWWDAREPHEAM